MALEVDFSLAQSSDCDTITFTETTGVYDASTNAGGYGAPNPVYTDVKNTDLVITFPDGTSSRINKGYLPDDDASPTALAYSPADFGYSSMPNGVWDVTFNVYTTATASGSISNGTVYIVTGTGSVLYNEVEYATNEVFTGVSGVTTYLANGAVTVNAFEDSKQCNFLFYCGVKECLKTLILQRCGNECECREDFHNAMNELIIDFNAAQLTFTAQNYLCANETIQRLERACGGICNDCGC